MGFWDDIKSATQNILDEIENAGGLAGLVADTVADPNYSTTANTGYSLTHMNATVHHVIESAHHSGQEAAAHVAAADHWDNAATYGDNAWDSLKNGVNGNGFSGLGASLKGMFTELAEAGTDTIDAVGHSFSAAKHGNLAGEEADLAIQNGASGAQISNNLAGHIIAQTTGPNGVQNLTPISFTNQMSGILDGDSIENALDTLNHTINANVSKMGFGV